jgi:hypothetical protein
MSDVDYASRQDWSPQAQPPGPDGVMAHTADPTKYFNAGNRTVIPRAVPGENFGASQGVMPTVIHIDPSEPMTGAGGPAIDMSKLDPALVAKATQLGRNPAERLEQYVRLASEAQTGSQPIGTPVVSQPAPVIPTLAPPPYVNNPPQAPVLPSPSVPPADQTHLLAQLAALVSQGVVPVPAPPNYAEQAAQRQAVVDTRLLEELKMPFLTSPPSAPGVPVIYYFPHGKFKASYHHVVKRGACLSLIYDNRLEGHSQFVPEALTDADGAPLPLRLEVPGQRLDLQVVITDLAITVGCLDIITLVVLDDGEDREHAVDSLHGHPDLSGGV